MGELKTQRYWVHYLKNIVNHIQQAATSNYFFAIMWLLSIFLCICWCVDVLLNNETDMGSWD